MRILVLLFSLVPLDALAEIVVPTRTIRPKQVIVASDLTYKPVKIEGMIADPSEVIGQEARVALYAGRPIRPGDFGPPAIVNRNDLVTLIFDHAALSISTEGRALGRGSVGERIRVMNLSSRTTVSGLIRADGQIEVQ